MAKLNINKICEICGKDLTIFQKNAICVILKEYEDSIRAELKREYEDKYLTDLGNSIDWYRISIFFVLHFGEKTKFGQKRLLEVMKDITATVDLFTKREYNPLDYLKMLNDDGIITGLENYIK